MCERQRTCWQIRWVQGTFKRLQVEAGTTRLPRDGPALAEPYVASWIGHAAPGPPHSTSLSFGANVRTQPSLRERVDLVGLLGRPRSQVVQHFLHARRFAYVITVESR